MVSCLVSRAEIVEKEELVCWLMKCWEVLSNDKRVVGSSYCRTINKCV